MSIFNGKKPDRSRYPVVSDKYWDFIEHCWSNAPENRPSAGSAVELTREELHEESLFKVPFVQAIPDVSASTT
jgi:hypothetical protein